MKIITKDRIIIALVAIVILIVGFQAFFFIGSPYTPKEKFEHWKEVNTIKYLSKFPLAENYHIGGFINGQKELKKAILNEIASTGELKANINGEEITLKKID